MGGERALRRRRRRWPRRASYRDGNLTLRLVQHDREEYDRYYNVFANPTLWFIHHYLWGLALEPSVDRNVRLAWEAGYVPVNERFADAAAAELAGAGPRPLVMVHDYQLFMVPGFLRARVPGAVIQHFTHIPWPQPDYWRVLPDRHPHGHPRVDAGVRHRRPAHTPLRAVVPPVLRAVRPNAQVDVRGGEAEIDGRRVRVRAYPISVDPAEFERLAAMPEVAEAEPKVLEARPEKLILRVDRTDPSKNVVRGFSAFDLFLADHPEWRGRVTMLALLDPSRPEIPEYAEYVGAIQRAARAVNDRYYTGDWMPIDLRISDNFPQAVAAYKHYDVLLVNAIFDGMNLIAKEAPLMNERDGVLILCENTGAHVELGRFALTVNPFDIQAPADAIHDALVMPQAERHERIEGIRKQVREHDIDRWMQDQLDDLAELAGVPCARRSGEARARGGAVVEPVSRTGDGGGAGRDRGGAWGGTWWGVDFDLDAPPEEALAAGLPNACRHRARRGRPARAPWRVHAGACGHRRPPSQAPRPGARVGRRSWRPEHARDDAERVSGRHALRDPARLVPRRAADGRRARARRFPRSGPPWSAPATSTRASATRSPARGWWSPTTSRRPSPACRTTRRSTSISTATCSTRKTPPGSTSPRPTDGAFRIWSTRWRRSPRPAAWSA